MVKSHANRSNRQYSRRQTSAWHMIKKILHIPVVVRKRIEIFRFIVAPRTVSVCLFVRSCVTDVHCAETVQELDLPVVFIESDCPHIR